MDFGTSQQGFSDPVGVSTTCISEARQLEKMLTVKNNMGTKSRIWVVAA